MAFRNDPIIVDLRAGSDASAPSSPPRNVRPTPKPEPTPNPNPGNTEEGATADECRAAYAEFRELAVQTERRWHWIAVITGVAGIGLGAAVGVWQGQRRAVAALPESHEGD